MSILIFAQGRTGSSLLESQVNVSPPGRLGDTAGDGCVFVGGDAQDQVEVDR